MATVLGALAGTTAAQVSLDVVCNSDTGKPLKKVEVSLKEFKLVPMFVWRPLEDDALVRGTVRDE